MRRTLAVAVASLLAFATAGCGIIGGGGKHYTLVAYFPRAVSLYSSSNVRVLGLPSGTVTKIEVLGDKVKVTMSMDSEVRVPTNVEAQLVPQSLIGERYVQLFPAWKEGEPFAPDKTEIPLDRTIVPVEPDEALAALNTFLKSLDPKGLGTLIGNLDQDLQGQGTNLNNALAQVSQLVSTFADKDQQLVDIVDNFDRLTTTLRTREQQLGDIMQSFSQATQVLADERQNLQALLASLSSLSTNALSLVTKHAADLHTDIEQLTRLAQSIDTNLGAVVQLLDSGPMIANGLINAYDPLTHSTNLRTELGPLVTNFLNPVLQGLNLPTLPCIPIDTACNPLAPPASVSGQAATGAASAKLPPATTPIDDLLKLLGAPTAPRRPGPSSADRVADGASGAASFVCTALVSLVGIG